MTTTYELRAGERPLATRKAATAKEALVEYARSLGCSDDEIVTVAANAISWRGAVFEANEVIPPEELPTPGRTAGAESTGREPVAGSGGAAVGAPGSAAGS